VKATTRPLLNIGGYSTRPYVALLLYVWVVWRGVGVVAPCLLLGFVLSKGSEPEGAERGADQQCMGTCVWVDAQRR
jgi:hypothetical protein